MECKRVIDERLLDEARAAFGTTSVQDTTRAAMRAAFASAAARRPWFSSTASSSYTKG
jgi:hypothetical protein